MKSNLMKTFIRIALLNALTFTLFFSTSFANSAIVQQQPDLVTLTVSSSCASANVRLSTGETLKTPFNKLLPRGQTITLEALDSSVPYCGALAVETNFRRFVVNNELLPKGQILANLTLEKDTSVFINYGYNDKPTVMLSTWSSCSRIRVKVDENQIGGQQGDLLTHFDLSLFQGQSIKLEAHPYVTCGNTAAITYFHHWSVDGKPFPQAQISIDVPVEKYTTAVAHYSPFIIPWKPLTSFQLLRNGNPVDFIGEDDKLKKYTVVLNADHFPLDTKVFVDGTETEIIKSSATQLEVKLLGKRAKTSGIIFVSAIAPVNQYFTPATIEVRRE